MYSDVSFNVFLFLFYCSYFGYRIPPFFTPKFFTHSILFIFISSTSFSFGLGKAAWSWIQTAQLQSPHCHLVVEWPRANCVAGVSSEMKITFCLPCKAVVGIKWFDSYNIFQTVHEIKLIDSYYPIIQELFNKIY